MDSCRYNGLLFGDISAVCGFLRVGYLRRLLQATVSHHTHTHMYTHTRTHTYTYMYTHTHTHTHTINLHVPLSMIHLHVHVHVCIMSINFALYPITQHVHDRLIHGSDYPVPAINLVIHTSRLKRWRYKLHTCVYLFVSHSTRLN